MPIEQGVVIRMGSRGTASAWVKMARSSACESCSERGSCMAGDGGQPQEVEALNPVNARVGDRIQIAIGSGSLLKAMFLLYLFPIICMMGGGLLGNWAAPEFSLNPSVVSVLTALVGLVLAMWIVRVNGQRMAAKPDYRPRIVRIIGRDNGAVSAPPASDPSAAVETSMPPQKG